MIQKSHNVVEGLGHIDKKGVQVYQGKMAHVNAENCEENAEEGGLNGIDWIVDGTENLCDENKQVSVN